MNLRWESLGGVYGSLTTAILSLPERDAFFTTQRGDRRNRRNFSVELKDCVQACITLSNYMDLINPQMVNLLVKNLILQTVISGDASKSSCFWGLLMLTLARPGCLAPAGRSRCFDYGSWSASTSGRTTHNVHVRVEEEAFHSHFQYRQRISFTNRKTTSP